MRAVRRLGLFLQPGVALPEEMERGDVVVLCGNPRLLGNYRLLWEARARRVATVWWGIGVMPDQRRWALDLRRHLQALADVVLLYSDMEVRRYLDYGFPPARLFATNNCLDQRPIQAARAAWPQDRLATFRAQHELCDSHVLLYCGRLHRKPRLELAIDALVRLRRSAGKYILAVIGDGPERAGLQELSRSLGVAEYVRWLGAIYQEEELAPWFLSSLCLVYPGAIGLTLHHSLGYGLPVVTTNDLSKQSAEIYALQDGRNSLLYREGDSDDLAACIHRLAETPALRSALSVAAVRTAVEEFTMENTADRFVAAVLAASRRKMEHS